MSEEQRPVRVRVVSNSDAERSPQRRRTDRIAFAAAKADRTAAAQVRRLALTRVALFLIACAVGGALVAGTDLLGVLGL